MADQTEKKVPQIRYKGFADEWVERGLLDNISKVIDFRGRTPKKLGLDWSESGYLALSALNVKNGYIDFSVNAHYGSQELYNLWMKGSELHKNQVLFTTEAPMGNVAQIPDDKKYILSQRTIAFDVIPELIHEDFLAILLGSPRLFKALLSLSSGGTAKGVSQKSLSSLDVSVPEDIPEQLQIGTYFQELDQLIGLHHRKHEKLVTLKKAMLKKMFPQNGATTPEIRFKGFSEPWEEKKLGETGVFNPKAELPEIFEYVDLESVVGTQMVAHRTETKHTAPSRAQRLARQGDLFFQMVRPYQKNNHLFTAPDGNYVFSTGYAQIRPFDDGSFLLGLMQGEGFLKTVMANCTGTGYPAISSSDLASIVVCIPLPDEQQKIGTYFSQLDELIAQHGTQLEKLKQIKTACLERMFI